MSYHPRLHPRTWLLTCCCLFIIVFLVVSFHGRLVLPAQVPQGTYSGKQSESQVSHDELLEDVANATLGVSTSLSKHVWFSTYRDIVSKDIRHRPSLTNRSQGLDVASCRLLRTRNRVHRRCHVSREQDSPSGWRGQRTQCREYLRMACTHERIATVSPNLPDQPSV